MLTLSSVTPVYCGAKYLDSLLSQMNELRVFFEREGWPIRYERAVFVLDDPIDNSYEFLKSKVAHHPWVEIILFSKNFGQHAATFAGMARLTSDYVFTLDEDLQHKPHDVVSMLMTLIENRSDLVYAKPCTGTHSSKFRDLSSKFYKVFIVFLTGNKHVPKFNSFRLIRGSVSQAAAAIAPQESYLDVVLTWFTNRVQQVNFEMLDSRYITDKSSGYNFRKLLSHARRLIISTNPKFLRLVGLLGFGSIFFSIVSVFFIVGIKLVTPQHINVRGWSSLFVVISFFGGVLALISSVILEYVLNIVSNAVKKPVYFEINRDSDLVIADFLKP